MLNLGKEMPLVAPLVIKEGEIVKLGNRSYKISFTPGKGYYLNGIVCFNDQMFNDLGIEDRYEWCRRNKIKASPDGVFPYMDGPNLFICINKMRVMFRRIAPE